MTETMLQSILRTSIRVLIVLGAIVTLIMAVGYISGLFPYWDYAFFCAIDTCAFVVASVVLKRGSATNAATLLVCTHLAISGGLATLYPEILTPVAVCNALAVLIVSAIVPQRLAYALLGVVILVISWLMIRPLLPIPSRPLGEIATIISFICTIPTIILATFIGRRIIQAERNARLELEHALQQLQDAQAQLVQAAQDRAVVDTAVAAAHELAQPLTVLLNETALLRESLADQHEYDTTLHSIDSALHRAVLVFQRIRQARRYVTTPYTSSTTMLNLDSAHSDE